MPGADLLGLGEHCSLPHCGQIDFLPFQCDCCQRVYCLEHRAYSAHSCEAAEAGAKQQVVPCPICARGIRLEGRDPNLAWEEHQRDGACDAKNWQRVHAKPRCPVKGCKEKLTTVSTYACKRCGQRVCLKHRHEDDHGCSEAVAAALAQARKASSNATAAAAGSFFSQLTNAFTSAAPSRPTSAPPPAAAASRQPPQHAASSSGAVDNTVRGTAERRRQQQQQHSGSGSGAATPPAQVEVLNPMHQRAAQPPLPSSNQQQQQPSSSAGLTEACPQCGARFASVERLVQHVEDFHPSDTPATTRQPPQQHLPPVPAPAPAPSSAAHAGSGGGGGAYGRRLGSAADEASPYRCPHCERGFSDPAVLVTHAEACPAAPRGRQGVAAGGAGKSDCSLM